MNIKYRTEYLAYCKDCNLKLLTNDFEPDVEYYCPGCYEVMDVKQVTTFIVTEDIIKELQQLRHNEQMRKSYSRSKARVN